MKLNEIIHVSGLPGLFKIVAQSKNGLIVESLLNQKRQPVSATMQVSSLADIFIYTTEGEMKLIEVFILMKSKVNEGVSANFKSDNDELKKYFSGLIPTIDFNKVHGSHMKKIVSWFEILNEKVDFNELAKSVEENDESLGTAGDDKEKPIVKVHEAHGPKAEQHAKVAPVKMRKKV